MESLVLLVQNGVLFFFWVRMQCVTRLLVILSSSAVFVADPTLESVCCLFSEGRGVYQHVVKCVSF